VIRVQDVGARGVRQGAHEHRGDRARAVAEPTVQAEDARDEDPGAAEAGGLLDE
jgi:hypothetical protein